MGQEQLQEMLEKLGSVGAVLPAVTLLSGLVLWLIGRRLARPACAFSGLVLGGIGGLMVGEALSDQGGLVLPMVIGAAIAGALMAALLFRVWMAASGALIFALAASAAVLIWQGPTKSEVAEPVISQALPADISETPPQDEVVLSAPNEVISDAIRDLTSSAVEGMDGIPPSELTLDRETAQQIGSSLVEALRGLAAYYRGELSDWWSKAGSGVRGGSAGLGLFAGVIGLLLGLIWPYVAASVQSAVAGSVLMLFSSFSLLAQLMPEHLSWLPATPRGVLAALGLITAVGLVLQWTFFLRKADK